MLLINICMKFFKLNVCYYGWKRLFRKLDGNFVGLINYYSEVEWENFEYFENMCG